jgi:hypothetical protein
MEELPLEVSFESTDVSATNSSFSKGASKQKRKITADVLEWHLQMKAEAKRGVDALKSQKAAAYQLKSYCLEMKQLMDLSNRRTGSFTSEQNELMSRRKHTIKVAVSAMETHIKAGTIWCPKSEEDAEKTPKSVNSSGNNKRRITGSGVLDTHSVTHSLKKSCLLYG